MPAVRQAIPQVIAMLLSACVMAVARVPLTGTMLEELLGKSRRDQILTAVGALPEFFEDGALKGGERVDHIAEAVLAPT